MSWIAPKLRLHSMVSLILVTSGEANLTANKPKHGQTSQYASFLEYKGHIESGGIPTSVNQNASAYKNCLATLKFLNPLNCLYFQQPACN